MPPPIEDVSDEESGDIPFNDNEKAKNDPNDNEDEDEDDEDDEEDEDEEGLYVVELIKEHNFLADGSLRLFVKWKGYDDLADHTWEPEENLKEGAMDILSEYYRKIGGRPQKPAAKSGHGRKRKSMGQTQSTTAASETTEPKRRRKSVASKAEETKAETSDEASEAAAETPAESDGEISSWVPKTKSWEKEVASVDTIIRDQDTGKLFAFLLWKNGKRSRVAIEKCYDSCPRHMLGFYESHLVFKEG
ncbi:hypothetical protein N7462_010699 [Penicillium macrosclerotiorum]|uniref:uncharacterized protein n=1 Tax=Penicillium macrosclerotiorum TaxID=303699 RepID=UPI002546F019|nr:uncharacterized protein N7462_010699 [Penicillium macrosclerotiorum]KAJ5669629.1 hypothetical protein N7462_010699 [Penicillium macrosclerotiorum]